MWKVREHRARQAFCPWGAVGALGANQVCFPWRTGGALNDKFRQLSTNNDNNRVLW